MNERGSAAGNPFEDHEARRVHLAFLDRVAALRPVDRDLVRLGQMPDLGRWLEQVEATGGCAHPVYLSGRTVRFDADTGEVLGEFSTRGEPGERLAVRCRNRRRSVCPACAWQYQGDAFHLVRAGLVGGKGVPAGVAGHPRVFVTLTAPSFGRVHRVGECHPRCRPICPHGSPVTCGRVHAEDDALVGQPLCGSCYDYVGHVLWNAHAGQLWKAFGDNLYHRVAARVGVGRTSVRRLVRVSAAKVAEYQKRGAVHFHAVLRLDGPDGPGSDPPAWATADLLLAVVPGAASAVALRPVESAAYGERRLRFGTQIEAHVLAGAGDEQVAGYVAKYTSKSTDDTGALDHRITSLSEVRALRVSGHVRALVGTCWQLGGLPELEVLRLRACAHMLGYRGVCLSKTRVYSTTFGALRAERTGHRTGRPVVEGGGVESAWRYAGRGYTAGQALVAAGIWADLVQSRALAKEAERERDAGWGRG
ncbi:replication initiator [Streptacidiphilus sp. N1-3]|uniref:Replication initiator n=1 Tax=Streptacidiphilus alkalitolerans TaxID=3342712 RepID=A0ABV6XE73_9ACTN